MCFPCFPIYAIIIYFRRKTLKILNSSTSGGIFISQKTRELHKQLIRALTFQAIIPIFWLSAASIYLLLLFRIIEGSFYENLPFRIMELMPMTTPIVSIYLVKPYRNIIKNWIVKSEIVSKPNSIIVSTAASN
ncbi:unnamed protein product [Caenorhabditis angaria]|uniref:Uncharacterized protein n=1 Tax=Caenorhabditis angaria TaxID=860376 RepID=A0A9P1MXV9_9PELO|nr:unnamed protein product [Caenorhabditis angaria]